MTFFGAWLSQGLARFGQDLKVWAKILRAENPENFLAKNWRREPSSFRSSSEFLGSGSAWARIFRISGSWKRAWKMGKLIRLIFGVFLSRPGDHLGVKNWDLGSRRRQGGSQDLQRWLGRVQSLGVFGKWVKNCLRRGSFFTLKKWKFFWDSLFRKFWKFHFQNFTGKSEKLITLFSTFSSRKSAKNGGN